MDIALPTRENIQETGVADPLKFYYWPIARSFYTARFAGVQYILDNPLTSIVTNVRGAETILCDDPGYSHRSRRRRARGALGMRPAARVLETSP